VWSPESKPQFHQKKKKIGKSKGAKKAETPKENDGGV
jgi:hypothetical protein